MAHTIGYIIETDDNVRLEYSVTSFTPFSQPEWIDGVNEFNDISEVDPNDVNTPYYIRVHNGNEYTYYIKTLYVPWTTTCFRISVLIDDLEGNNSFIYEGYNSFIETRRVGSEIYTTVNKNKRKTEREAEIKITYRSDESSYTVLRVVQEPCDISLKIVSCIINNGVNESEVLVGGDSFEYQFDTLIDRTDASKQSVTFLMDVHGVTGRFYIKSIKQYVSVGEIDDTYKFMDGKFYKREQKYVNENFVSYYSEAVVIDNIGYQLKKYDNAFSIQKPSVDKIKFINYGRTFMEDNSFYDITLANCDDISVTCHIRLTYANNPSNFYIN